MIPSHPIHPSDHQLQNKATKARLYVLYFSTADDPNSQCRIVCSCVSESSVDSAIILNGVYSEALPPSVRVFFVHILPRAKQTTTPYSLPPGQCSVLAWRPRWDHMYLHRHGDQWGLRWLQKSQQGGWGWGWRWASNKSKEKGLNQIEDDEPSEP